jgi:hypothetical protein
LVKAYNILKKKRQDFEVSIMYKKEEEELM